MRQDCHGVCSCAELGAAVRYACNRAGLNGQRHGIGNALFCCDVGDLLRCAGAEVDDCVLRQLHSSTACEDLLCVQRNRRDCVNRNAEFAGQCAVIRHTEALHVLFVRADNNTVDIDARNGNQLRIEGTALYDLLNLYNDLAAAVLAGLSHCGDVQRADLAMYGAVAELIAVGSAQEYNINREALVQQALLAFDLNQLDEVFLGAVIQLAAAVARVSKGVQTDMGNGADVVRRDIAVHMGNNALRQVVCFDLVVQRQLTELRCAIPVTADNALNHALVTVMVAAGAVTMALTCCEEQGQILRMTGFEEALLQCGGQGFRAGTAYETAGGNRIAILDAQSSLFRRDNLYFLHGISSFLFFVRMA